MAVEGSLPRLAVVAALSFRSSLRGLRTVGLAVFALVPSLLILALASAHISSGSLEAAAQELLGVLTLPIVVMVIVLIIAVAQFRNEIDGETLVYLTDRSVGRAVLVFGKYLGAWAASLLLVLPATLLPLGIAAVDGAATVPSNLPLVAAAAGILASAVYVGIFLFLGLVSRSALMIGLIYGFLWEELLLLLPGSVPRLTIAYYLRCFLSGELSSGPLSGFPTGLSVGGSVAVAIGVTLAFLLSAVWVFRTLETAPERVSA
jgi:ABC-2 type transport system permease protein